MSNLIEAIESEWETFKKCRYQFWIMDSGGFGGLVMGSVVGSLFIMLLIIVI